MTSNMSRLMQSIAGIPRWVQLWMLVLMGTNMASLAFLHTLVGLWTAITFGVVGMLTKAAATTR